MGVESLIVAPFAGPSSVVVSAAASTVKVRVAGVRSTSPAASVAFTSKVWVPSESVARVFGVVQLAKLAVSTRHWNVEPASELEKPKVGVESLVVVPFAGPESIVVSGGSGSLLASGQMPRCWSGSRRSSRP